MLTNYEREPKGVPIGRAPTVNLRNNHTQYIFTWYVPRCSFLLVFLYFRLPNLYLGQVRVELRHVNHVLDGRQEAYLRYPTEGTT